MMTRAPDREAPRPRYIGPRNAEAVIGHAWRWVRDHAKAWGVPVLRVDAKPLIDADAFAAAVQAHAVVETSPEAEARAEADELEAMCERIRRAG
jgi:hypothetical protein